MQKATQKTTSKTEGGQPKAVISSSRFYVRKWPCAVCGGQLLYDSKAEVKKCDCGIVHEKIPDSVLRESFEEVK